MTLVDFSVPPSPTAEPHQLTANAETEITRFPLLLSPSMDTTKVLAEESSAALPYEKQVFDKVTSKAQQHDETLEIIMENVRALLDVLAEMARIPDSSINALRMKLLDMLSSEVYELYSMIKELHVFPLDLLKEQSTISCSPATQGLFHGMLELKKGIENLHTSNETLRSNRQQDLTKWHMNLTNSIGELIKSNTEFYNFFQSCDVNMQVMENPDNEKIKELQTVIVQLKERIANLETIKANMGKARSMDQDRFNHLNGQLLQEMSMRRSVELQVGQMNEYLGNRFALDQVVHSQKHAEFQEALSETQRQASEALQEEKEMVTQTKSELKNAERRSCELQELLKVVTLEAQKEQSIAKARIVELGEENIALRAKVAEMNSNAPKDAVKQRDLNQKLKGELQGLNTKMAAVEGQLKESQGVVQWLRGHYKASQNNVGNLEEALKGSRDKYAQAKESHQKEIDGLRTTLAKKTSEYEQAIKVWTKNNAILRSDKAALSKLYENSQDMFSRLRKDLLHLQNTSKRLQTEIDNADEAALEDRKKIEYRDALIKNLQLEVKSLKEAESKRKNSTMIQVSVAFLLGIMISCQFLLTALKL